MILPYCQVSIAYSGYRVGRREGGGDDVEDDVGRSLDRELEEQLLYMELKQFGRGNAT